LNIQAVKPERERRSATRYHVRARAWLAFRDWEQLVAAPALVLNISTGGALIETPAPCRVGSLAYLSMPASPAVLVRVARRDGLPSDNRYGLAALHMPICIPPLLGSDEHSEVSMNQSLDVSWPCSAEEIRRAYRASAKRLHPDVGGTEAEFIELNREVNRMLSLLRH
jgi:hypothetical protein